MRTSLDIYVLVVVVVLVFMCIMRMVFYCSFIQRKISFNVRHNSSIDTTKKCENKIKNKIKDLSLTSSGWPTRHQSTNHIIPPPNTHETNRKKKITTSR